MSIEKKRVLIIGEVLFDKFSDSDNMLLGGAPFNIAWNLKGFGLEPLFISRVGDDYEGELILDSMQVWGLSTDGIQIDNNHKTGKVLVDMSKDSHSFSILENRAYDFIEEAPVIKLIKDKNLSLIYHGSLIKRGKQSRKTLSSIISLTNLDVFTDVNLRDPYWNSKDLEESISKATWVKVNDEELRELIKMESRETLTIDKIRTECKELLKAYSNIKLIAITIGSAGAILQTKEHFFMRKKENTHSNIVDTVGAGDAFSSLLLVGILKGWETALILKRAEEFASSVCTIKGALHSDKSFYTQFLDKWKD